MHDDKPHVETEPAPVRQPKPTTSAEDLEVHGSQSEVAGAAREYVEHHPDGPYRDLADRVLAHED